MPDTLESVAREIVKTPPMYLCGDFSLCSYCGEGPHYEGHRKDCLVFRLQRVLEEED